MDNKKLGTLRGDINSLDDKILDLLKQRAEIVTEIETIIENIKVDDIIGSIISKNKDEDTIFRSKLAVMELDDVKKSKDTKAKQEIRKANTLIEVIGQLKNFMK